MSPSCFWSRFYDINREAKSYRSCLAGIGDSHFACSLLCMPINSRESTSLCLPSACIISPCHHTMSPCRFWVLKSGLHACEASTFTELSSVPAQFTVAKSSSNLLHLLYSNRYLIKTSYADFAPVISMSSPPTTLTFSSFTFMPQCLVLILPGTLTSPEAQYFHG